MNLIGWLTDRLTPDKYRRQLAEAEADAEAAREALAATDKRGNRINELRRQFHQDHLRNHYAERVRAAYAGRKS